MAPFSAVMGTGNFFFILVSGIIFLVSMINPTTIGYLRIKLADASAPILATISMPMQAASDFVQDVSGLTQLQAQNEKLLQDNIALREWFQKAQILSSENKALRDLLNVAAEPQDHYVTARIIADSGNTFVKSVLVMAGENNAVREGQAVVASDGVVGRVVEAGQNAARVLLINDINSRIPVWIEDHQQHAILAGQNTNAPELIHLPPHMAIRDGARVVTSGFGGIFPKGLPVGEVYKTSEGSYAVRLYADLDHVMYVRIIERSEDPNLIPAHPVR